MIHRGLLATASRDGDDRRTVARAAAGMYGGAMLVGLVEAFLPGGESASILPTIVAPIGLLAALAAGARAPRRLLVVFGPLGACLIGLALATTRGVGDGAVLYMWPSVWTAYFFGNRATAFIIAWIAAVHGTALLAMPSDLANLDRWIDVVVAVLVVAVLVRLLAARNERLLQRLAAEARLDPLTGLLNRRGLQERFDLELARASRDGTWLAVASFDVDRFKAINDAAAARSFAQRVGIAARDAAASGDEALTGLRGLHVTVSGGVAAETAPAVAQPLLDAADHSLYEAKQAGRDTVDDGWAVASPAA